MRPGKERRRATRPKEVVVVVMVGRETSRSQSEKAAAACDWTGWVGSLGNGGRAGTFQVVLGKPGHGKARQGRAGHGRAWLATALTLGPGHWEGATGNSKTVHRPHANQNPTGPTGWG